MEVGASSRATSVNSLSMQRLDQTLAAAAITLMIATAVVLWARRLSGAFQQPLSPSALLFGCAVLSGLGVVLRLPLFHARPHRPNWLAPSLLYGTSLALFLVASLLTMPGQQPWWSWFLLWLGVVVLETFVYCVVPVPAAASVGTMPSEAKPRLDDSAAMPPRGSPLAESVDESELPESVIQRFERSADPELGEIITGQVRARFDFGQRTESVHIAFCPPFGKIPHVDVEPIAGPPASAKSALVVPHGARIDIRLDRVADGVGDVVLEVFVQEDKVAES